MHMTTVNPAGGQPIAAAPMQNVVILPQHVVLRQQSPIWTNYATKSSSILGSIQIIIGILCVLCSIVTIVVHTTMSVVGHGIWGGLFFILTGAFGLMAGKQRTTCPIIAFMTLSILSASIFAIMILSLASVGIAIHEDDHNYNRHYNDYHYDNDYHYEKVNYDDETGKKTGKAMEVTMLVLSLIEIVVAIWSSAICCSGVCCGRRSQSGTVLQQGTQVYTSHPQTGHVFQQQANTLNVGQQQQLGGAPTNQVPQLSMPYPTQCTPTAAPPPYGEGQTQGATAVSSAPMQLNNPEQIKLAF